MSNYNRLYVKIGMAVPNVSLGRPLTNAKEIIRLIKNNKRAALLVFPEMCITGYNLKDWLYNQQLLEEASMALKYLLEHNDQLIILGHFFEYQRKIYNATFVIKGNEILGVVPENGHIFPKHSDEKIEILGQKVRIGEYLFSNGHFTFGVELGAQLWEASSQHQKWYQSGADIVFCSAASPFHINNGRYRRNLAVTNSLLGLGAFIYTSVGITETSSGHVYSGHQIACELGKVLTNCEDFDGSSQIKYADIDIEGIKYAKTKRNLVNQNRHAINLNIATIPFVLEDSSSYQFDTPPLTEPFYLTDNECASAIDAITAALHKRLSHIGISNVVIGVSGGLDSTLVLLMACEMVKRYGLSTENICGITLPAKPTSKESLIDAQKIMTKLHINQQTIDIKTDVIRMLEHLKHQNEDTVYENIQARYRNMLLLNKANQISGLMLGTSDMTEAVLGFCTFGGDMVSMYNPNGGLPKTTVRQLVRYFKKIYPEIKTELESIIKRPISPELLENQVTEDILGSYEINDFIMFELLAKGSSQKRLVFLLQQLFDLSEEVAINYYRNFSKRFKANQFKRHSMPESVKIFEIDLNTVDLPGDLK